MSENLLNKALKNAQNTWSGAKKRAQTGSFGGDIPDGRYKACITKAELGLSKTSNRLQVSWTYEIMEGEYLGKPKMDWDGCDTEDNQMWLGRKLARLGYEIPEDINHVESILAEIQKQRPVVRITIKTKGEFQKVYVDKLLDDEDAGISEDLTPPSEDVEDVEEEVTELETGMKVTFEVGGEIVEGEVIEIDEKNGKARVKTDGGTYKVGIDLLSLVEEDDDAIPEEPEVETETEIEIEVETPTKKVTSKPKPKAKPKAKKVKRKRK